MITRVANSLSGGGGGVIKGGRNPPFRAIFSLNLPSRSFLAKVPRPATSLSMMAQSSIVRHFHPSRWKEEESGS